MLTCKLGEQAASNYQLSSRVMILHTALTKRAEIVLDFDSPSINYFIFVSLIFAAMRFWADMTCFGHRFNF